MNKFQIFNEDMDPDQTMSDADYTASPYRIGGVVRGIADPTVHNKLYRQLTTMAKAMGDVIAGQNLDADDADPAGLAANIVATIKALAKCSGLTLSDITDIIATTTELNYSSGLTGNIQRQIDAINSPLPLRIDSTAYAVGDVVLLPGSLKRLECVAGGTTDLTAPASFTVGQLVQDGTCTWIVDEFGDAKVGTVSCDYIVRPGWIKASGATVNRADFPRLWAWATANNLTSGGGAFGTGDGSTTFDLPDFTGRMIQLSMTAGTAVAAGLPNVTGEAKFIVPISNYGASKNKVGVNGTSGAFKKATVMNANVYPFLNSAAASSGSTELVEGLGFDASLSNAIYGSSSTVQPPAVTMLPVIKY